MFEQTFRNIDDVLWKEAGCATELDYTEQTSWILFLRYLDDLEPDNSKKAELQGEKHTYIIDKPHRWSAWAAPKRRDGSLDHDKALTGDDLIEFVNRDLFPYLQGFRTRAEGANTIEYKIGEIFGEIKNKFQSGCSETEVVDRSQAIDSAKSILRRADFGAVECDLGGGRVNEAETRAELIDPARREAGWGVTADSRVRRETICPGRIEGAGRRGQPEIAAYVLTFRNHKLGVIEAKARDKPDTEGVGQAKAYAAKLQARFAYSTNGRRIYRIDMETGAERYVERYPRPDDGKDYFTIYDFEKAYEHFNDPEWDGEPMEPVAAEPKPPKQPGCEEEGAEYEPPPERPKQIKIRLADGKERTIQHMMATSYWSPDGKPISANQMIEKLFGELPHFFKDEDELRRLWSKPDTRKALLQSLAEKGFGPEQLAEISRMINAEKSDVFDVLAYIAFALAPITRSERVEARRNEIFTRYDGRLQAFLDFVLAQYVKHGVGELDQAKLGNLLELKYHTVSDAADQLGGVPVIRDTFVEFQQYLYR